jgi:hypothetical protein
VLALLVVLGAAAFALTLEDGVPGRAWEAFLVNLLFWLGIAQGGVVVSASLYITQARWGGAGVYRLAEAFAGFVPVGFVLFWLLLPGRSVVFPWIQQPVPEKAAWLNSTFLFLRDGGGLLVLTGLTFWFIRASRRRETREWAESTGSIAEPPATIRRLAPSLVLTYVVVYSLLAFDLVMSLSPIWYSTLFGAYFFAGAYWSALAAMGLVASWGVRSSRNVLHDIGKLVFAFSIFWAYLLWSQYLPIWYAGLPEETFFVVQRVHSLPWGVLAWTALVLVWVVPFVVLMGRKGKRTPAILGAVCAAGLAGMWIERYVLVAPSLSPRIVPFGWSETGITAGFVAAFVLCARPGLRRVPVPLAGETP